VLSVEAATTIGWQKYAHESIGINTFGTSGFLPDLQKHFGFTPDAIEEKAKKVIEFYKGKTVDSLLEKALH